MTAANLERKLLRFPAPKLLTRIVAETTEQNRDDESGVADVSPNVRDRLPDSPARAFDESPSMGLTGEIAQAKCQEVRRALRRPDAGLANRRILHGQTRVPR
jgi:hypothetical protein